MASSTSLTSLLTEAVSSNTGLLLLGSTLAALFFFWWTSGPSKAEIFARRNVKYYDFGIAMLTLVLKVRTELERDKIFKKEKEVVGDLQMFTPTIFMTDPNMVQQVLSKNFTSFTNRRIMRMTDPVFSNALFMIEDEKWKRCRSIMTPTFSMGKLKLMKPILDDTANSLINNFANAIDRANGQPIEVKEFCGAFTMDTIVQIAFGVKVDSIGERDNTLLKHAKSIFQKDFELRSVLVIMCMGLMPSVARFFKLRMNPDALDFFGALSTDVINNKRKTFKNPNGMNNNGVENSRATNFIELLLEAENERLKLEKAENSGPGLKAVKYMTNDEIVAQCITFLMVGYDTTATSITLTLYNLALHPEVQERLYEEITSTLKDLELENEQNGQTDGPVVNDPVKLFTMEKIQKMKYLESVIKETLRIYPPATMTERTASEDVTIENGDKPVYVKKGDVVNIPIYTMHRDPAYWSDPETYNPDRFLDPNPTYHKYSYLPFGAGPRDCIAKSLAYLEAKVAVLHAVRMYKFSKCDKTPIPVQFYFQANLLINKDIHLNVERRN